MHPTPTTEGSVDLSRQARQFGALLAAVCGVLAASRWWHGHGGELPWWLGAGAVFAASALWQPRPLKPLVRGWLRLGEWLHAVTNPLLMALLYAVAVVPVGLAMRLFGKDPLRLKRDAAADTYWVRRDTPGQTPGSMTDQF